MIRKIMFLTALILFSVGSSVTLADTLMTFEEFVGHDSMPVGTFYSGITFQTLSPGLSDWVGRDHTTGAYNTYSEDLFTGWGAYHIRGNGFATTALDTTGNGGKISFDNADATFVELLYSAYNPFYMEAHSASGTLIDTDSGPANLGNLMGTLRVDWNGTDPIAYVTVHDTGDFWLVDNILTDATGITTTIPAPGAILLGTIGAGLVGWLRRRRAL